MLPSYGIPHRTARDVQTHQSRTAQTEEDRGPGPVEGELSAVPGQGTSGVTMKTPSVPPHQIGGGAHGGVERQPYWPERLAWWTPRRLLKVLERGNYFKKWILIESIMRD